MGPFVGALDTFQAVDSTAAHRRRAPQVQRLPAPAAGGPPTATFRTGDDGGPLQRRQLHAAGPPTGSSGARPTVGSLDQRSDQGREPHRSVTRSVEAEADTSASTRSVRSAPTMGGRRFLIRHGSRVSGFRPDPSGRADRPGVGRGRHAHGRARHTPAGGSAPTRIDDLEQPFGDAGWEGGRRAAVVGHGQPTGESSHGVAPTRAGVVFWLPCGVAPVPHPANRSTVD